MDFARKILNKYGWKEGEGLGKHSDGIVKPLKASMKFDNAGLGSDQAASDFNNHWWERVFNEAASNVEVRSNKNGVAVDLKIKDDSVEISTKGYSLKKLKRAKQTRGSSDSRYDNFLQSATLNKSGGEIENPNKITVTDISVMQHRTLTDEELFRACGGRTAHKGARHGLKLSGKLSRIEQQEKELLAKMQAKVKTAAEPLAKKANVRVKRKKSKTDKLLEEGVSTKAEHSNDEDSNHCIEKKFKELQNTPEDTKKRNKKDKAPKDIVLEVDSVKKSKHNKGNALLDQTHFNVISVDSNKLTRKKRKCNDESFDINAKKSKKKSTKPKEKYDL